MEIPFMDASTSLALKSFMKSADSMAFTTGLFEFMNCTRHRCLGRFAKMDNGPYCLLLGNCFKLLIMRQRNRHASFNGLLLKEIELND